MVKPIIRLTIGPVHRQGFEILARSSASLRNLYPECDIVICHNQLPPEQTEQLSKLGVKLHDQNNDRLSLPEPPRPGHVEWKLYPPRLRPDSHEVFIDNDILLFKKLKEIDEFLQVSDHTLLYEGLHGLHGRYTKLIAEGTKINSGIFGLPPQFPFEKALCGLMKLFPRPYWSNKFDEQGLVAATLSKEPHYMISQTSVPILEPWMSSLKGKSKCGIHFVGANYHDHPGWRQQCF